MGREFIQHPEDKSQHYEFEKITHVITNAWNTIIVLMYFLATKDLLVHIPHDATQN